jgi:hypothetical protein
VDHFYQAIDGWFNFRDIYDAAIREAGDGAVFVEVGSWYGRSAAYMAVEIANSGKRIDFYCVDTWKGSVDSPWMAEQLESKGGSALPYFRDNMHRGGVSEIIKVVEQPSLVAAGLFPPSSIDFVMIDGAHDYASVRDDVRSWLPRLKPGSLMAGDDANWPGVLIGVHETIPMSELAIVNSGSNWFCRNRRPDRGSWSRHQAAAPTRDYLAYIPCVNRPDLLERAVRSVQDLWDTLLIVDQTVVGLRPEEHPWVDSIAGVFRVACPPLSFTQMMNWAQAEARERGVDYMVFMHNDAECVGNVAVRVLEYARRHPEAGVVFTNYDAVAVFRVRAIQDVGPWDETFRWYFADVDYYHRMKLHGWQLHNFGGQDVIHHASQTQQADPAIARDVGAHWKWHGDHYRHKWGGAPGNERYLIPYNGRP